MPTIKKKVRKLEAQEPTESRRLWRHLTKALYNNDLENATASKHEVGINKDCWHLDIGISPYYNIIGVFLTN